MLNIPNRQALVQNIDPADLEDLQAEAEANRAEARDARVDDSWHWTLPEKYQG